ncbi:hypothetical protein Mp_5g01760 [Marchantia polymorpha subsp. ruderalis]|uniref:Uncharacterized protein n=2 Tax=Marchantia polymorpha TaxID=3197 RepID=A0AAF6BDW1_MARPO|nr:hypothetical protein MARPO_0161s0028 [Marchantia polymorpha]BBN10195.1 hypothetical protein Mp_5g01760 [Marchantia polymorpha subsp. ruderalis]|eukprot:PTQ28532.1 hypothetical protein MARPO_0161s0028 [Marchantia polymorpha]
MTRSQCIPILNLTRMAFCNRETGRRCVRSLKVIVPSKPEICRYHGMPGGCVRGEKCFYAHSIEDLQRRPRNLSPLMSLPNNNQMSQEDFKKKVFVGGLSPSIESEYLRELFEAKFGPVVDAVVISSHSGDQVQSRGFGFVTFQHEESVSLAVKTHYVSLCGKKVEIKGAVPRSGLSQLDIAKRSPTMARESTAVVADRSGDDQGSPLLHFHAESELEGQWTKRLNKETVEPAFPGGPSSSMTASNTSPSATPHWVLLLKHWLPTFLKEVYKRLKEGEWYPLSSLKDSISPGILNGGTRNLQSPVSSFMANMEDYEHFDGFQCVGSSEGTMDPITSQQLAENNFHGDFKLHAIKTPVFPSQRGKRAESQDLLPQGSSALNEAFANARADMEELKYDITNDSRVQSQIMMNNFSEEPKTPLNQVSLTPFSTLENQPKSFPTHEMSSASSSYDIWGQSFPNLMISNNEEKTVPPTEIHKHQKSAQGFGYTSGGCKSQWKNMDTPVSVLNPLSNDEDDNQFIPNCMFCFHQESLWVSMPCKDYVICSSCTDSLYKSKGNTLPSMCSVCYCEVDRWEAVLY